MLLFFLLRSCKGHSLLLSAFRSETNISTKSIFSSFQALHSIAKCVSALTVACPSEGNGVVNQFVKDIKVEFSTDILYCVSVPAAPGQPLIQTCFFSLPKESKMHRFCASVFSFGTWRSWPTCVSVTEVSDTTFACVFNLMCNPCFKLT